MTCALVVNDTPSVSDAKEEASLWTIFKNDNGFKTRDYDVTRALRALCTEIGIPPINNASARVTLLRRSYDLKHKKVSTKEEAAALVLALNPLVPFLYVAGKSQLTPSRLRKVCHILNLDTRNNEPKSLWISFATDKAGIVSSRVEEHIKDFLSRHSTVNPAIATGGVLAQFVGIDKSSDVTGVSPVSLTDFCSRNGLFPFSMTPNDVQSSAIKRLRDQCNNIMCSTRTEGCARCETRSLMLRRHSP